MSAENRDQKRDETNHGGGNRESLASRRASATRLHLTHKRFDAFAGERHPHERFFQLLHLCFERGNGAALPIKFRTRKSENLRLRARFVLNALHAIVDRRQTIGGIRHRATKRVDERLELRAHFGHRFNPCGESRKFALDKRDRLRVILTRDRNEFTRIRRGATRVVRAAYSDTRRVDIRLRRGANEIAKKLPEAHAVNVARHAASIRDSS
jgi:hypothetical protein